MSGDSGSSPWAKFLALLIILVAISVAAYFIFWDGDDDGTGNGNGPGAIITTSSEAPPDPGGGGSALPDIVVTDLRTNPQPATVSGGLAVLNASSQYALILVVANTGQADVPGNVVARFSSACSLDAGGALGGTGQAFIGTLAAGETKDAAAMTLTTLDGPGSCTLRFEVDPDDIYAESDESDLSNVWETEVLVQ